MQCCLISLLWNAIPESKKVLLQSKVLGATIVFLEVRVSNFRAISFYEKFGFKRDAIRYNYYAGSSKEDALLMSKQGL